MTIRKATAEDAEELLSIYAPYVRETAITFEYEVPSVGEFRGRIVNTLKKYPYLVAEKNGGITGYVYASPFKERAAYAWAAETSIYVKDSERGSGIGRALYEALEACLRKQHVINLNACITYPNPGSIAFHESFGYVKTAHFTKCGYKMGKWYDMIWMEKMLGEHPLEPRPVIAFEDLKY